MLKEELGEAIMVSIQAVKENNSLRLLADCSGLTGGHSLFDLYENAGKIPNMNIKKEFKEAVLLPVSDTAKEKVEFWETVTNNLGFKVKVFDNREKAIKWLNQ